MRHDMTIKGLQSLHSNATALLRGVTWASRQMRESSEPGSSSSAAAIQCRAATAIVFQALTTGSDWLSPISVQQQLTSGSLPAEVGDCPTPLLLVCLANHTCCRLDSPYLIGRMQIMVPVSAENTSHASCLIE